MNSKILLRATLPLIALISLGSAQAQLDDASEYTTLADGNGVSAQALQTAIAPLFDTDVGKTQSLIVMHDGKIVAERYAEGFGPETKLQSWSIAKAVTTVLVGLMVSDGRLALDSPVPLDAWSQPGDPRGQITLRHLLTMSSGLDHREGGAPLATSDTIRMIFTDGAQNMAGFAESKPVASRPGTNFHYSTGNTMIVSDLMTRMLTRSPDAHTRRDAMDEFITGRLADPVGLHSLTAEYDARGTLIGGLLFHMTTRDYARFGEFLRERGKIDGRQILSPRWVDFMKKPSARNPAYGGGIWLNREGADNPLFPGQGPRSLFACFGHNGQYVIISPTQRLVIVRMGITAEAERPALTRALTRLVETVPTG